MPQNKKTALQKKEVAPYMLGDLVAYAKKHCPAAYTAVAAENTPYVLEERDIRDSDKARDKCWLVRVGYFNAKSKKVYACNVTDADDPDVATSVSVQTDPDQAMLHLYQGRDDIRLEEVDGGKNKSNLRWDEPYATIMDVRSGNHKQGRRLRGLLRVSVFTEYVLMLKGKSDGLPRMKNANEFELFKEACELIAKATQETETHVEGGEPMEVDAQEFPGDDNMIIVNTSHKRRSPRQSQVQEEASKSKANNKSTAKRPREGEGEGGSADRDGDSERSSKRAKIDTRKTKSSYKLRFPDLQRPTKCSATPPRQLPSPSRIRSSQAEPANSELASSQNSITDQTKLANLITALKDAETIEDYVHDLQQKADQYDKAIVELRNLEEDFAVQRQSFEAPTIQKTEERTIPDPMEKVLAAVKKELAAVLGQLAAEKLRADEAEDEVADYTMHADAAEEEFAAEKMQVEAEMNRADRAEEKLRAEKERADVAEAKIAEMERAHLAEEKLKAEKERADAAEAKLEMWKKNMMGMFGQ